IYLGDTLVARRSTNRPGDLLRDGRIELTDAMIGLQLAAGRPVSVPFTREGDIGGDGRIGLAESVHDLRVVAGELPNESYELFWYDTDYLGSPMTLSDESGDVLWQTDTLPFGEAYEETGLGALNKRRYLGKELDPETGLLYFGARYLDGPVGRFVSADPVGLVDPLTGEVNQTILSNSQRLNRYVYGLNNPYRYVDPDGEFAVVAAAIFGAAIAYMAAPDIANAPESSSTPIYESHGVRSIAIGAATGCAAGIAGKTIGAGLFRQSAYDIAVGGGRHAGQLRQFMNQNSKQLFKSIKSYNKRISEHKSWIKNPSSKVPNFNSLSREHQGNLIHHWNQDIKRAKELKSIAKKVLKKRR
ncbi:RHS repeat domain-containing protein, partial [Desulfofustis glycolicus]